MKSLERYRELYYNGVKDEIAKNLLKENVDVETISKATGLTAERKYSKIK